MTREEAIKILKRDNPNNITIRDGYEKLFDDRKEAFGMAIKALEQEPCEDCISRQAVIDACDQSINLFEAVDRIKELASVTPHPKTGHWIIEVWNNKEHHTCSNCQHVVTYEPCYHYCPYCGAMMVESQESEG